MIIMFKVKCKSDKFQDLLDKVFTVYSVRNDNNGYPHFLIYCTNKWLWISAKYFEPVKAEKHYLIEDNDPICPRRWDKLEC